MNKVMTTTEAIADYNRRWKAWVKENPREAAEYKARNIELSSIAMEKAHNTRNRRKKLREKNRVCREEKKAALIRDKRIARKLRYKGYTYARIAIILDHYNVYPWVEHVHIPKKNQSSRNPVIPDFPRQRSPREQRTIKNKRIARKLRSKGYTLHEIVDITGFTNVGLWLKGVPRPEPYKNQKVRSRSYKTPPRNKQIRQRRRLGYTLKAVACEFKMTSESVRQLTLGVKPKQRLKITWRHVELNNIENLKGLALAKRDAEIEMCRKLRAEGKTHAAISKELGRRVPPLWIKDVQPNKGIILNRKCGYQIWRENKKKPQ